ncbi:type 4a pilus biogenesis protein PilO [Aestuariibacter salexigens]|uniref:type 4a pilus biogenesis protein PilO n=1 Tax=Aestuariibacter salexigens TaxID=226010 RepID=UPI000415CBDD|nr:type 4a pilus biogenesis protein PilO [Aestuariibacter salexigens]
MKFDVTKLKEMNDLDFEQIPVWPAEVKIVVATVVAILVGVLGYYTVVSDKIPVLEKAEAQEIDLKQQYAAKYRIAVNLAAYEEQLARIEEDFSSMLKSLPTSNETPGLLDDVTRVGTTAGLNFRLLNWQQEVPKEFYTELPIQLQVSGTYHEIGEFSSAVANLSRIVTLHDFDITQSTGELSLNMQAKTYRTSTAAEVKQ